MRGEKRGRARIERWNKFRQTIVGRSVQGNMEKIILSGSLVHMCCVFFIFDCLIWNEQAGKTLNDSLFYFNVNCLFMCLFA